jgi:osmoprotectant transport system ATP-binding protein
VSSPAIEFRRVSYVTGGRSILRDVTLRVEAGETLVLLGRSGSGKTTLLKMVNRLYEPTSGEIVVEGKNIMEYDAERLRRSIGFVIQDGGLFPHRTVEQNIGLVPRLEGWQADKANERVRVLMNVMGLDPNIYAGRYPRRLSGGEKQRVGIARALAADPRLLLLDEPFAALDPITRFELQQHFLQLRRELGKTAIFVTHDIREALMMASRIAVLSNGAIETVLPVEEFDRASTPEASAFLATLRGVND